MSARSVKAKKKRQGNFSLPRAVKFAFSLAKAPRVLYNEAILAAIAEKEPAMLFWKKKKAPFIQSTTTAWKEQ